MQRVKENSHSGQTTAAAGRTRVLTVRVRLGKKNQMNPVNFPRLLFVLSLVVLWFSVQFGEFVGQTVRELKKEEEEERQDFGVVAAAILTLLGLLIGFTFSMAMSRYDQRKNYEEAEANAIGTEYVRADLMPSADAERVRNLLRKYLDQRILFYVTHDEGKLEHQHLYGSAANGAVVNRPKPRCCGADPSGCPRSFGHE
jgi:hypothetical protein